MKVVEITLETYYGLKCICLRKVVDGKIIKRFPQTETGRFSAIQELFSRNIKKDEVLREGLLLNRNYDK